MIRKLKSNHDLHHTKEVNEGKRQKNPKKSVIENADLLRAIGEYIHPILPFVLSFKSAKEALQPIFFKTGEQWITSRKRDFVTSIAIILWAQSVGCIFDLNSYNHTLFSYIAYNGSVEILKWGHRKYSAKSFPSSVRADVCAAAAENNQLEILKYLFSLRCSKMWDDMIPARAALSGHLRIIRWLRSLNPPCPWDEWTCANAAFKGHLHILKWLRSQEPPCPWSDYVCNKAASAGHLFILKWLRSQEIPCPWVKRQCLAVARDSNHPELVEWISSQEE